jgi:hypothetical protein
MEKFTAGPNFPRLGKKGVQFRYAGELLKLQHEGCLQNISTATSCGCVSALSQHNSDEVDKVGYYQKATHHTRNLPVPDQSQERQVDHDHDR